MPHSEVEQQISGEVGNATQQDDKQASKADEDCAGVELENSEMEEEVQQESKIEQPEKDHKKVPFWRPWEGGCYGGGDEERTSGTQTESSVWRGGTGDRNITTNYSLPPTFPSSWG